jgi:hypothetical protein
MTESRPAIATLPISRFKRPTPLLPKPANFFGWSRLGEVYYLECSHFEPFEYNEVLSKAASPSPEDSNPDQATLKIYPTDQFLLSARDAIQLFSTLQAMLRDMSDSGIVEKEQLEGMLAASSQQSSESE